MTYSSRYAVLVMTYDIVVLCGVLKTQEPLQYLNQQVLYQPRQNTVRSTSSGTSDNSVASTDSRQRPSDRADLTRNALRPSYNEVGTNYWLDENHASPITLKYLTL